MPAPAEELYQSDWFKKARAYVLSQLKPADTWYILSAKYQLVEPRLMISPYNETLNTMGKADRCRWAEGVVAKLRDILSHEDHVVILAGGRYRELLVPAIGKIGCTISVPLVGLRIGEQLRWFNSQKT